MQALAKPYTNFQATVLVALRILIGWHFLYEGLAKLTNPYWSAAGYLSEAQWWFDGTFLNIAASPSALAVVDFLNIWGLILIGLGLVLGCLARHAAIAGVVLLALYYIAAPPFVDLAYSMPSEGSYLVVNKVLIELVALLAVMAFPTSKVFGLDRFIYWKRSAEHGALGSTS
jgi:thiosulfate dehydrogenase [quinone] large subunit